MASVTPKYHTSGERPVSTTSIMLDEEPFQGAVVERLHSQRQREWTGALAAAAVVTPTMQHVRQWGRLDRTASIAVDTLPTTMDHPASPMTPTSDCDIPPSSPPMHVDVVTLPHQQQQQQQPNYAGWYVSDQGFVATGVHHPHTATEQQQAVMQQQQQDHNAAMQQYYQQHHQAYYDAHQMQMQQQQQQHAAAYGYAQGYPSGDLSEQQRSPHQHQQQQGQQQFGLGQPGQLQGQSGYWWAGALESVDGTGVIKPPAMAEQGAAAGARGPTFGSLWKAVAGYTPRMADEMAIEVGDQILVEESFRDGWAKGWNYRNAQHGAFPLEAILSQNQM
ncbi:hypothetical protein HK101_010108 [Irineochytrium annulatum]|nr:hypothetical protein HK101_010108 [Irineochytrium annulatum]